MDSWTNLSIAAFVGLFALTAHDLWRRDLLFGAAYGMLFLYGVFALIGYQYLPHLSESIGLYFGEGVLLPAAAFCILSLGSFYLCSRILLSSALARIQLRMVVTKPHARTAFLFVLLIIGSVVTFAALYWNVLDYGNASDPDFLAAMGVRYGLFIVALKTIPAVSAALYGVWATNLAQQPQRHRLFIMPCLCVCITVLLIVTSKIGNRTDVIALLIGCAVAELSVRRSRLHVQRTRAQRRVVPLAVIAGVLAVVWIQWNRAGGASGSLLESVIAQDYFPPAHMLFGAMSADYCDPGEVLRTNASNALMFIKYPYLQERIQSALGGSYTTRSASHALYLFAEGFVALGWFGWIYNGLIPVAGLTLWRTLSRTRHPAYNAIVLGVVATQIANLARGQSSYFVKDMYLSFLPALVLVWLVTGRRPSLGSSLHASPMIERPSRQAAHSNSCVK
jgi:hypothetical protein